MPQAVSLGVYVSYLFGFGMLRLQLDIKNMASGKDHIGLCGENVTCDLMLCFLGENRLYKGSLMEW